MTIALIVITTHGVLRSCTLSSREIVSIPEQLNIIGIQATPLGVVNVLGNDEFGFMKHLIKGFKNLAKKTKRSHDLDHLVRDYALQVKENLTHAIGEIQETHHSTKFSKDMEIRDFTISSNICSLYDYSETPLIEKEFLVGPEDTSPEDNIYNWKINIFLDDGRTFDLMEECFKTRAARIKAEGVKLSFILNCLIEKFPTLTNLIILDLSCNTLDHDDFYDAKDQGDFFIEDRRATRAFRRDTMKYLSKGKTHKKLKNKYRRKH